MVNRFSVRNDKKESHRNNSNSNDDRNNQKAPTPSTHPLTEPLDPIISRHVCFAGCHCVALGRLCLFGKLVGWLVGWLVGQSVDQSCLPILDLVLVVSFSNESLTLVVKKDMLPLGLVFVTSRTIELEFNAVWTSYERVAATALDAANLVCGLLGSPSPTPHNTVRLVSRIRLAYKTLGVDCSSCRADTTMKLTCCMFGYQNTEP